MTSLIVTPHDGIGPLRLGMSHDQILTAIHMLSHELQLPSLANLTVSKDSFGQLLSIRYISDFFFFMVQYRDNHAVEIAVDYELRNHLPILLYNIDVFNTPAMEIMERLKKLSPFTHDLEDEQLSTNYEFPQLGLRLWREHAFHPKLLNDVQYMKKMEPVIDDMYRYQHFQLIAIQREGSIEH